MQRTLQEQQLRYGGMLIMRGGVVLVLAVLSVLFAGSLFMNAILAVSSLLVVLGLYEMAIARRMRTHTSRQWWLPLLNGSAMVGLGVTSVAITIAPIHVVLWMIAAWFCYYTVCLTIGAALSDGRDSAQHALLLTGVFHLLCAFIVLLMPVHPHLSILALPSLGAGYVVALGAWQMGAGSWLLRNANRTSTEMFLVTHPTPSPTITMPQSPRP